MKKPPSQRRLYSNIWDLRETDNDILMRCTDRRFYHLWPGAGSREAEVVLVFHPDFLDGLLEDTNSQSIRDVLMREVDYCRDKPGYAPLLTITPNSKRVTRWAVPPGAQPPNVLRNQITYGPR